MSATSPKPSAARKMSPSATVRARPVAVSGSSRRRRNLAAPVRASPSAACSPGPWPGRWRPPTRAPAAVTTAASTAPSATMLATGPRPRRARPGTLQLPPGRAADQLAGPDGRGTGPPGVEAQLDGVVHVGEEVLLQSGDDRTVVQGEVQLVVERERAVVEVDRPDGRTGGVHDQDLGVQHGPLVLEDAHAAPQH